MHTWYAASSRVTARSLIPVSSYYNLVTNYFNPLILLAGPVWSVYYSQTRTVTIELTVFQVLEGTHMSECYVMCHESLHARSQFLPVPGVSIIQQ